MAAGLGYKEFSTGDVLTAADANGYLASQVVMVFASAAARTSAIASPQEGMISYLKDTNAVEKYDGSAWVSVGGGGGGKVLQVVNVVHTTSVTTSSATLADTGLTATITPSLSTSKVLVLVNHNGVGKGGNLAGRVRLMRGASQILFIDSLLAYTGSTAELYVGGIGATYLDSPATTSATTYKTQFASDNGATFAINTSGGGLGSSSTITLIEIGA